MSPHLTVESKFAGLGISPHILTSLSYNKYLVPTPIQEQAIPVAITGKDLIGIAQTGTGKTLAFGVPMIQRLGAGHGRGLVLVPTRELALQADETFTRIGRVLNLRTAVLIGGASMRNQMLALGKRPQIIIATPGRLLDHLSQKTISLLDTKILVLDEADRMLDMGFLPQISKILTQIPKERQTLLFSATMPAAIALIAKVHMKLPVRVEIARSGTTADNITQELYVVARNDKPRLLEKILASTEGPVLVFSRTKFGAKKLTHLVQTMGHQVAEIHANRSLAQRREALDGFKRGKYRVLVATDIAARGIDVTGIALVVNFDLPENAEDYVHRIGRTARAGRAGRAVSFATPDQGELVRGIEKLIRSQLPISKLPELPPERRINFPRGRVHNPARIHGNGREFDPILNTYPRLVTQNYPKSKNPYHREATPKYPPQLQPQRQNRPLTNKTITSPTTNHTHQSNALPRIPKRPKSMGRDPLGRPVFRPSRGPKNFIGGAGV